MDVWIVLTEDRHADAEAAPFSDPYFTRPLTAAEASRPLTAEELADPSLGACKRMRPGCRELGPWRFFYRDYVCDFCLHADSEDVKAHRSPPGNMGTGTLFRREES